MAVDDAGPQRRLWGPHDFVSLPSGRVAATCVDPARYRGDPVELLTAAGGLAELTADGQPVREIPAADPAARGLIIAPAGAAAAPALDRLVTTNRGHGYTALTRGEAMPGISVQVWRLQDLQLLKTVVLEAGPRGEENLAPATVQFLHHEPMVYVNTAQGGALYASDSVQTAVAAFKLVYDFGADPHVRMGSRSSRPSPRRPKKGGTRPARDRPHAPGRRATRRRAGGRSQLRRLLPGRARARSAARHRVARGEPRLHPPSAHHRSARRHARRGRGGGGRPRVGPSARPRGDDRPYRRRSARAGTRDRPPAARARRRARGPRRPAGSVGPRELQRPGARPLPACRVPRGGTAAGPRAAGRDGRGACRSAPHGGGTPGGRRRPGAPRGARRSRIRRATPAERRPLPRPGTGARRRVADGAGRLCARHRLPGHRVSRLGIG